MMFSIACGALGLACSSSDTTPAGSGAGEIDAAQAKQVASTVAPGTAGEPTKLDKGDEHRWVVNVKVANGATVAVEISRAGGVVEEIKGTEKPFDYELPAPAAGQLPYAQAKAKALALKTGAVEQWEVKPPENQYEFYVRDANERLWEIKLTADKGETKSVEEKAVAD
ncbi:MAG: hypothetical protein KC657_02125 [Myxococcales bacterium]|nr:hypothetical protein [Myxococcales bacterium]